MGGSWKEIFEREADRGLVWSENDLSEMRNDLDYLIKMREMDREIEEMRKSGRMVPKRPEMTHVVPIAGLVMGRFVFLFFCFFCFFFFFFCFFYFLFFFVLSLFCDCFFVFFFFKHSSSFGTDFIFINVNVIQFLKYTKRKLYLQTFLKDLKRRVKLVSGIPNPKNLVLFFFLFFFYFTFIFFLLLFIFFSFTFYFFLFLSPSKNKTTK